MEIVVQMMIRNEQDVIYETLSEITKWDGIYTIVILDAESDDNTVPEIQRFISDVGKPGLTVDLHIEADPPGDWHNPQRQRLLDLTREHKPDWILSLDADEIYHTNPVRAIEKAHQEGANVVWNDVPEFWLTYADLRAGALLEDEKVSVQERRRWYSWGHTGCFIWKDLKHHFYPPMTSKRTPEFEGVEDFRQWQREGSIRPVCKHYCFRSIPQSVRRMQERLALFQGKYHYGKYAHDWIIDERVCKLAKFKGMWKTTRTHELVHQWMGRHRL